MEKWRFGGNRGFGKINISKIYLAAGRLRRNDRRERRVII